MSVAQCKRYSTSVFLSRKGSRKLHGVDKTVDNECPRVVQCEVLIQGGIFEFSRFYQNAYKLVTSVSRYTHPLIDVPNFHLLITCHGTRIHPGTDTLPTMKDK